MDIKIILKNIPEDYTADDIESVVDDLKEPINKCIETENRVIDWIGDIQVFVEANCL